MMNTLMQRFCVATLVGTALSMGINVEGARADILDNIVNNCIRASQIRQLNFQEIQYCNRQIALKRARDNRINTRNLQYRTYLQNLRIHQSILQQGANPVIIRPTDFGVGNR